MKIIVGLGNPGEQYSLTRHNAGWLALDALASERGLAWERHKKSNSHIAISGDLLLAKPQTYMNNSGAAVSALMSFYQLLPKKLGLFLKKGADLSDTLTVVHDDLDIPLGKSKESVDSRAAGHKGVASIISRLGTKNFRRIRIGIKTEMSAKIPAERFVLERFRPEELEAVGKVINELIPIVLKN